jgi:hypothetical protein
LAFTQVGSLYTRLFFPLFHWQIERFEGFEVVSMDLEKYQSERMIRMEVSVTENPRALPTEFLQYWHPMNQYLHPIIMFSILAAWPGIALRDRLRLGLMALPFLILVEMLDLPLGMVSICREKMNGGSLASYWISFLNGGGREFLAIFFSCTTVACFYLFRAWRVKAPGRNEPCPCGSGKKYKRCCMLQKKGR